MIVTFKNIEKSFHYIRWVTVAVVLGMAQVCSTAVYFSFRMVRESQMKTYVIADGKVLEALGSSREDNLPAEAKDQVYRFHEDFFTLSPDQASIKEQVNKALSLADASANQVYERYEEKGFYTNLIEGNVTVDIHADSVSIDLTKYPYPFRYYGTLTITRLSSITTRRMWTSGTLRIIPRSGPNSHGLLIEHFEVSDDHDIRTVPRNTNN
jgi:conjugative transposon TraK protein